MQNKVDLAIADRMVYCCLVCLCDLTDLDQFTFFCSFLKRRKNGCFFLYAHIAVVSTVVIAGNCIQSMISIFCDKLCNIGSMKSGCCRTSPELAPFARISSAFNRHSARLSLFSLRACSIPSISFSRNLYLEAILIT